jgi:AraC family L-rhamnose operon transcriptional activator RhaR
MENENVCFFIPKHENFDTIHTVHFVFETTGSTMEKECVLSLFRMCLVIEGEGIFIQRNTEHALRVGDVFFCLPAMPLSIKPQVGFKYAYISYIGSRANYLMDKFRINEKNCVFHGFESLIDFWYNALQMDVSVADIRSESVLLYTFSSIATKYYPEERKAKPQTTADNIKKYIDVNFSDPELSLHSIAKVLSYNKKYVSASFKENFKVGISDYITTIRIQYACSLLENGAYSIKKVALQCGFNDPLYFSKLFRKKMGLPPTAWMRDRRKE